MLQPGNRAVVWGARIGVPWSVENTGVPGSFADYLYFSFDNMQISLFCLSDGFMIRQGNEFCLFT